MLHHQESTRDSGLRVELITAAIVNCCNGPAYHSQDNPEVLPKDKARDLGTGLSAENAYGLALVVHLTLITARIQG